MAKLSEAQRRVLTAMAASDEPMPVERFVRLCGDNRVVRGLFRRNWVLPNDIPATALTITPAGRAALRGEGDGGPSALTTPQGER